MYLTDEQIMLLEQLTYLTDDVADAAGVLLGPYDSVENLLQQFDDDALQRLEDPDMLAKVLAYFIKYVETYNLSEDEIRSLAELLIIKRIIAVMKRSS